MTRDQLEREAEKWRGSIPIDAYLAGAESQAYRIAELEKALTKACAYLNDSGVGYVADELEVVLKAPTNKC